MVYERLSQAIGDVEDRIRDIADRTDDQDDLESLRDAVTLLGVLRNVARGKDIVDAMGSPGDFGYNTALGKGIVDAIKTRNEKVAP